MVDAYKGPGTPVRANVGQYDYQPFDVAIAFLTLMFLPVPERQALLLRLRELMRPGGAIIIFDKEVSPGGYPATVLGRLTWEMKAHQGVEPCRCPETALHKRT